MKKIWLTITGVVVLLAVLMMAGCSVDSSPSGVSLNSQQQGLWVNGEGKITVAPDMAIITLGIESQETAVSVAQAKASEAMAKVLQALNDQGIEDKDIQTQYFNISQTINWYGDKQEVTGYRVTNTVTVKVRDMTKPGQIIDAVVAAGGDLTRINGITFTVEEPASLYVKARATAIDHAVAKAKEIAAKTGVKLGKITYVSESSNNYGMAYRNYALGDAMAAPAITVAAPVSIGELEITATVQIAYAVN